MTHPIHSADSLLADQVSVWRKEIARLNDLIAHAVGAPIHSADAEREATYRRSEAFEAYWAEYQECPEHSLTTKNCAGATWHAALASAAAQVGANGAADSMTDKLQRLQGASVKHIASLAAGAPAITMSISDDKGFPEVLSEFVCNMEAGQPFGKGSMALTRYIDVWAARRFLAAGAPAETPKPDEHDYRIAQHEQVDAAILSRLIVERVVDRNRVVALRREIRPTIATPAATIGAGEGQDAARLEFLMEREAWIAWSKDGESCRVFHRDEDGDTGPIMGWIPEAWAHDPREAIDKARAAMGSKTSPGEAG